MQNLPGFANQGGSGVARLESGSQGTQAIISDYSFDCYGNVTEWGAFVERSFNRYTLDFQVWRRSGGGQGTTGEYDFVGSNSFPSISPGNGGQILEPVPVEQQIQVRPGDVIGFYVRDEQDRDDNGVELHTNSRDVTVWFITTTAAVSTRIEVGSSASPGLHSSTTGAPVITAMVVPSTPTPSQTSSPSLISHPPTPFPLFSSPVLPTESILTTTSTVPLLPPTITQTGTPQTTQTPQTQAPVQLTAPSTPQSSSFLPPPDTTSPPVGSGLPVGVIVAIVIVVLIVIVLGVLMLVFILALVRRRRSKKTPDSSERSGNCNSIC